LKPVVHGIQDRAGRSRRVRDLANAIREMIATIIAAILWPLASAIRTRDADRGMSQS